jgi:hypothetical protein
LGYTDPLTIVIKFHWGLNVMIQNKIVELGKDCPRDNLPAGWYTMVQLFDQNCIANHAFQNPHKKSQTTLATLLTGHSIFLCPLISQVSHAPLPFHKIVQPLDQHWVVVFNAQITPPMHATHAGAWNTLHPNAK